MISDPYMFSRGVQIITDHAMLAYALSRDLSILKIIVKYS